jgi:hypothetical protein
VSDGRDGRVLVVRLWREPGASDQLGEAWRGRVEDVGSGEWRHFVGLHNLVREIMALIGNAAPLGPADRAQS